MSSRLASLGSVYADKGTLMNRNVCAGRRFLVIPALALALGACAPTNMGLAENALASNPFCNAANNRCITVSVANGQIIAGDLLISSANHIIWWQMATAGYRFPDDGITIASTLPNEFTCRVALQGLIYFCVNRNTTTGTGIKKYKYSVKVTGSPAVPPLDPWILNE
jgi:hypothetical protein